VSYLGYGSCDPKIGDDCVAFLEENVLGLDVSMNDVVSVGGAECVCYFGGIGEHGMV
jgi:hypothetical protein